jgi:cell division protease FtsH
MIRSALFGGVVAAFIGFAAFTPAVSAAPTVAPDRLVSTVSDGAADAEPISGADAGGVFSASLLELTAFRERGEILVAQFHPEVNVVEVVLTDGSRHRTYFPPRGTAQLMTQLLSSGVEISLLAPDNPPGAGRRWGGVGSGPSWSSPLLKVLVLLLVLLTVSMVSKARSRRAAAKAPAPIDAAAVPSTLFGDVAGCEEAVEELREVVAFLQDPDRFSRLGAKPPGGVLLYGPPGTGKTLLARAVAGEAGVAFFAANGSDFVEMYVGVGPQRIRALFDKARQADGAIVFIDEIDALARARSSAGGQGHQEHENTLMALLAEMDGFRSSNVVVIGATNRLDVLDSALLRPGRMDRKVAVPNPDRRGREAILGVHTRNKPLAEDVDLALIAARTPGMSGAELECVANEAALEAVRRDLDELDGRCFDAAVANVAMGRARSSALVTAADRRVTAWHEAGHTVVAMVAADAPDPVAVSIVPRGPAGGVTWMGGSDDQFLSRSRACAQLAVALGGRAAEELLLDGEFTQGASGDLSSATNLARDMVVRYGMTRRGLMVRDDRPAIPDADTDAVVEELLTSALDVARSALVEHRELFDAVVGALLDADDLGRDELSRLSLQFLGRPLVSPGSVPLVAPRRPLGSVPARRPVPAPTGALLPPPPGEGRRVRRPVAALHALAGRLRRRPDPDPARG